MDGQQSGGDVGEHPGGDGASGKVGAGTSGGVDGAGDHDITLVDVPADVLDEFLDLGVVAGVEDTVDGGPVGAGAHPLGVRPRTGEQLQAGDHHGLAGAGLTGDHGEALGELGDGFLDDSQIADLQLSQHARHRRGPRHPVTGRRNFCTRRSVKGSVSKRTQRTSCGPRRISTRAPGGMWI